MKAILGIIIIIEDRPVIINNNFRGQHYRLNTFRTPQFRGRNQDSNGGNRGFRGGGYGYNNSGYNINGYNRNNTGTETMRQ